MVSREEVLNALSTVRDPEIGLPITELNMVKDIKVSNRNVDVLVALTVAGCPMAHTLQADVSKAVSKLAGVASVNVDFTTMSKEELEQLKVSLQGRAAKTRASGGFPPGLERLDKKSIRSIIAVVSGKGGVGKSFVSAMLATELRRQGYEVGVLDADITGPSIAKMFGVTNRPNLGEKGLLPPKTKTGIKIISINLLLDDPKKATIWRGPIISNIIKQLYSEVDWGDLHYLIIDLPPGTSDAPLTVYQFLPIDGIVIVTTPQDLALMIVGKAVDMARAMNIEPLGVIENMSYVQCPHCSERIEVFGKPGAENAARHFGAPVLGTLPLDHRIAKLSDKGLIEDLSTDLFTEITRKLRTRIAEISESMQEAPPIAWKTTASQSGGGLKMYGK